MTTRLTLPREISNEARLLWRGDPMSPLGYERNALVGSPLPGKTMSFQPMRRSAYTPSPIVMNAASGRTVT